MMRPWTERGVRFVRDRVTPANLGTLLGRYLSRGDLLVDLAWNIDCCELLQWWPRPWGAVCEYVDGGLGSLRRRRLQASHRADAVLAAHERPPHDGRMERPRPHGCAGTRRQPGPDFALDQARFDRHWPAADRRPTRHRRRRGGNTSLDRYALVQSSGDEVGREGHPLQRARHADDRPPKQVNEFVNTWSIEGLREEGITTAEMGWGTHEKELPPLAFEHSQGPKNQICLARMGMNTWVRTFVPGHQIHGMVVRHGRGLHDHRLSYGLGRRSGDLPADGPLRVLPVRQRDCVAPRAARQPLPLAAQVADHGR